MGDTAGQKVTNQRHSDNLTRAVEWVESIDNPERRALAATWLHGELSRAITELAAVRNSAIRDLWGAGWTYRDIATLLGVTVQRVSQIVQPD